MMEVSEGLKRRLEAAVGDLPRSSTQCLATLGWTGDGFRSVPVVSNVVQALQAHHDAAATAAMSVTTQDAQTQTEETMEDARQLIEDGTPEGLVLSAALRARD